MEENRMYDSYLRYMQLMDNIDMMEGSCETSSAEPNRKNNPQPKISSDAENGSDEDVSEDDFESDERSDSESDGPHYEPPKKKVDLENPYRGLKDGDNPLEAMTDVDFLNSYKFGKKTIYDIMESIKSGLIKHTNRGSPVPPLIELLITLKYLTTGSVQKKAMNGVSQSTISRINTRVTKLIVALQSQYIIFPDNTSLERNKIKFYERGKFPHVAGCIGSAHVGVRVKGIKDYNAGFINENGYHSVRVQIHKLMLEDHERMMSYKMAILNNKSHFDGKIVMDVGAGSSILSLFCAMAGAKKVYAVEASDVAKIAKDVIKENKFENIIEVIHDKVENVKLPNDERVDIIVSEWMGFYLMHEGMLDSVIYARDKFLKPDGLMYPESATIYMAPCSLPSMYDFWNDVYGVKMKTVASLLRISKSRKPEVLKVDEDHLLAEKTALCWIDLRDATLDDIEEFSMKHIIGASKEGFYQGMCIWFDCQFPPLNNEAEAVILSTSPSCPPTHWKQTVIVLPEEHAVENGQPIAWNLSIKRSEQSSRRYDLQLTLLDPMTETHPTPCSCHMTKCLVIKTYFEQYPDGNEPFGEIRDPYVESGSENENEIDI